MNLDSLHTSFGQEDEARLWEYIDGNGDTEERSVIEKLVEENKAWRDKYHELLELHQIMQSSDIEEPSMRFTKNIMEEISKLHIAPAAKNYINKKIIWGIGGFMIAMIVGFLVYGIAQIEWSEGNSYASKGFDFTQVDYSKMFNNNLMNVFMMLNIVLGLIFFDRYLANRKNKHVQDS
jgi:hypothetical protein